MNGKISIQFCNDEDLGYRRSLTPITPGGILKLDEQYRLAHLPLINPMHPDAIRSQSGKDYSMGRHARIHSLVLPIPMQALEASLAYQEMQEAFRAGPLAGKLAWELLPLRREKLHATLCGNLGEGEVAPVFSDNFRTALQRTVAFEVELRGFLSGNFNIGRLYLKAYPETRDTKNCIQDLQQTLGRKETDLYLVGFHNLKDHLTVDETLWLMDHIREWWDRPILSFTAKELWLLSATDDLVLQSRIEERFQLAV
jgi:hypothetical protein